MFIDRGTVSPVGIDSRAGLGATGLRWHPDLAPDRRSWCRRWQLRSPVTMPRWASRCDVIVQSVTCKQANLLTDDDFITAGFDGEEPSTRRNLFTNDWLRRYGRHYPDNLWWLWVWAITVQRYTYAIVPAGI